MAVLLSAALRRPVEIGGRSIVLWWCCWCWCPVCCEWVCCENEKGGKAGHLAGDYSSPPPSFRTESEMHPNLSLHALTTPAQMLFHSLLHRSPARNHEQRLGQRQRHCPPLLLLPSSAAAETKHATSIQHQQHKHKHQQRRKQPSLRPENCGVGWEWIRRTACAPSSFEPRGGRSEYQSFRDAQSGPGEWKLALTSEVGGGRRL